MSLVDPTDPTNNVKHSSSWFRSESADVNEIVINIGQKLFPIKCPCKYTASKYDFYI